MKTLKFAPDLVVPILRGSKTVTWRLFDDKDITAGDELALVNTETGLRFARARASAVRRMLLGQVADADLRHDDHERYADGAAMRAAFARHYGDRATDDAPLTIVEFVLASPKYAVLEALREKMAAQALPLMPANLVFGEGDPDAAVLFVGEAPGANEDAVGRPFVGRAGKLLNAMLAEIGWQRDGVYITNIVKRRPPDNRDPLPEEIAAYSPYLTEQIAILDPRVIVPLGRFAMNYFLPAARITRDQGMAFPYEGRTVYPVFHPAAALRSPAMMAGFRASFARLPAVVKK